ncbi:hypothetical protein [Bifidobacterium longum]|uniref:hypothetical protein n=1 Tax=Bifidobacterium longum TaxID=216816 RepID=UPI00211C6253|nr:hypothetical protein [Bifidobacterium longum]
MSKARKTAASSGEPDFWRVARDWLHHWLPKVRGSSPKTVEAYRIGLESYVRWLETTEGTQRSHIGFVFCFNVCSTGSAVFFRSVG